MLEFEADILNSSGIGFASLQHFARLGAKVAVSGAYVQ